MTVHNIDFQLLRRDVCDVLCLRMNERTEEGKDKGVLKGKGGGKRKEQGAGNEGKGDGVGEGGGKGTGSERKGIVE